MVSITEIKAYWFIVVGFVLHGVVEKGTKSRTE
jgi:hypothetical protein